MDRAKRIVAELLRRRPTADSGGYPKVSVSMRRTPTEGGAKLGIAGRSVARHREAQ